MWGFHESQVISIAHEAGEKIMQRLADPATLNIRTKSDGSRVTDADYAAHAITQQLGESSIGLHSVGSVLTPGIPVLSEELPLEQQLAIMKTGTYWCVDPLDGTETAIHYAEGQRTHNGFGVMIALVKDGKPVFGVAHFPAQGREEDGKPVGLTYYTSANGKHAFRQEGQDAPQRLRVGSLRVLDECRVVRGFGDSGPCIVSGHEMQPLAHAGGGRFLRVAEGKAELAHMGKFPAIWDIAAITPIVRAAGGEIMALPDGVELSDPAALKQAEPLRFDGAHAAGGYGPLSLRHTIAGVPEMLRICGARNVGGRSAAHGA